MDLLKQQIAAIVEDLEGKKSLLKDSEFKDIPPEYVGTAVYGYVIDQLKGLIKNG